MSRNAPGFRNALWMSLLSGCLAACQTLPPAQNAAAPTAPTPTPTFETPVVAEKADSATRSGAEALGDLQKEFLQVPNPEILGYVYPHLSGTMPVPGYYTVFALRDGMHYAQPGEGDYAGGGP
jgi:conjugative transfer region lipoprotein (TIGR03751 family)